VLHVLHVACRCGAWAAAHSQGRVDALQGLVV
jgi:hypothetical protein